MSTQTTQNTTTLTMTDEDFSIYAQMTARNPLLAGNCGSDSTDYRAMLGRALEARHFKSVANQIKDRETIMRQIEREQDGRKHVCHVFEDDLRGMER